MAKKKSTKSSSAFTANKKPATRPGLKTRRGRATSTDVSRTTTREKQAPLPESCHYTKTAAQTAAKKLRAQKIKARVVTSGTYHCVYTVNKCVGGKKVGVKRG